VIELRAALQAGAAGKVTDHALFSEKAVLLLWKRRFLL